MTEKDKYISITSRVSIARRLSAAVPLLIALPMASPAEDIVAPDFRACGRIIEASERLACYDAISREHDEEQATVPAALPATPEEPQEEVADENDAVADPREQERFVPLTHDIGDGDLKRRKSEEPKTIRAQVTKCQLGATGKYYFYFDNGQVWRQTDDRRQEYVDCDFSVTIKKDMFGYKMQPEIEGRPIRIKRIK